ncbi:hypothetical protein [Sutcliffiella horikoshii]|uniref:hypothetical protein n=1 Tax=Sutcliffiella horikoshii TaxID=79883 RepID=UPI003CEEBF34
MAKFKSLDDARKAYMNGKITSEEFSSIMRKHLLADENRKSLERESKKIERKLSVV